MAQITEISFSFWEYCFWGDKGSQFESDTFTKKFYIQGLGM